MEKIKYSKVRRAVFDHLHMVMFMSINPDETIDDFKAHGKKMVVESFDNLQLGVVWTRFFGLIIANTISKRSPFQIWHNLKPFCYGCITWMHVHFSHIFELHHGLKVCCACPCRALDGWASLGLTLKSRHTNLHRVLSWGFKMLVISWTKDSKGCCIDWLVWRLTTMWHDIIWTKPIWKGKGS